MEGRKHREEKHREALSMRTLQYGILKTLGIQGVFPRRVLAPLYTLLWQLPQATHASSVT